ncbi:MAG: histidine kinase [Vicinamibacteria bacterium]|nr:histidine kinase [Vicinamibacteria bacterium]
MNAALRLAAAVTALWTLLGVVWGAQASLGAALSGQPAPLAPAVAMAWHQSLPLVPATLAVIALAERWRELSPAARLLRHALALPLVALGTNALVVLGFGLRFGRPPGLGRLLEDAAFWTSQRLHLAALLYVAGIAATRWVRDRQRLRERELALARREAGLERARLQVLTAQIRPHFLFNTLHAIGQLWRSGRADEADALLDHLGALFQKVIASTTRTSVPLSRELEMVADYLAIEQARFRERLRTRIEVAADARACAVPPLLLQPLVENAVRHGVSARAEGGEVTIGAAVEGGRLVLRVEDDGPGANGETAGTGTALANLRERLHALYGGDQALTSSHEPGRGTRVRVELPARVASEDGDA